MISKYGIGRDLEVSHRGAMEGSAIPLFESRDWGKLRKCILIVDINAESLNRDTKQKRWVLDRIVRILGEIVATVRCETHRLNTPC
jgi:hypothetical protein